MQQQQESVKQSKKIEGILKVQELPGAVILSHRDQLGRVVCKMISLDTHRHQGECRVHETDAVAAVEVLAHRDVEEALICLALVRAQDREVR